MPDRPDADEYSAFIRRVRLGDDDAAERLVRLYEPEIRLEIRTRLRLRDQRLRRVFDSVDICQSVLAGFFARAAVGEFDLDDPRQLVRLLVSMARNKLAERVRYHKRQSRDVRRVNEGASTDRAPVAIDETPSQLVSGRELLAEFRAAVPGGEARGRPSGGGTRLGGRGRGARGHRRRRRHAG